MQFPQWDHGSLERLCAGDATAWVVFLDQAMPFVRSVLLRTVEPADIDDECMIVMQQIWQGLQNWDPAGKQSIGSFVWLKADSRRRRYREQRAEHVQPVSVEELVQSGYEPESDLEGAVESMIREERSSAIISALTKLDTREYLMLRSVAEGYSLAEAATKAGYPHTDKPSNVIRRAKRSFADFLMREPYFRECPEELAGLNLSAYTERQCRER